MPEPRSVVEVFEEAATRRPGKAMLRARRGGVWRSETFADWRTCSELWARGLIGVGLKPGDRVAILAGTSPDWLRADMAILMAGGVTVPIYPSMVAAEVAWILADCGARLIFAADPVQVEKLVIQGLPETAVERIICLATLGHRDRPDRDGRTRLSLHEVVPDDANDLVLDIDDLEARGRTVAANAPARQRAALTPADSCTWLYTSGTTGDPKGVMLSHANFDFETQAVVATLGVGATDTMLVLLPLAHVFGRLSAWAAMRRGVEMIFPRSPHTLLDDLSETSPTIVPCVPLILERLQSALVAEATSPSQLHKRGFQWAMATAMEVSEVRQQGRKARGLLALREQLVERTSLGRIRARLGGRIRMLVSGGAPLSRELAEFYHALGLLVLEGYGMTENTGAATLNRPGAYKLGMVGQALPGVQVRLAEDGEVLLAGANLMIGYHGSPKGTPTTTSTDRQGVRWLHTGDIGELDEEGFLRITDRKKDIIVTAGGKNVAPQNIENHLRRDAMISQVMVFGDDRPFLSALITLDEFKLRAWAQQKGIPWTTYADISQQAEVYAHAEHIIERSNRALASYETIRKFAILDREMSHEDGDLTPTMKVRREAVAAKHAGLLESFYQEQY